ncbi:hypothetical protein OsI_25910 [Oryza sativa Indica Group]|uniref:Uncharacterized protein n=1 Tax=Oryza sativa subsp. indica TaxID=39946 RepID=A2YL20_ORYSI|nr:hypothetical protein OsI_25910 [Oryza sativa Indica Group]
MAAAGPSLLAPSRPGAGVVTMAAGRRGRGGGTVRSRRRRGGGALCGVGGAAVGLRAAPAMTSPAPVAPPDLAGVTTAVRRWGSARPATGSVDASALGRWQVACSSRAVSSATTASGQRWLASGRRRLVRSAGGARPGADCRVVLAGGSRPAVAFAGGGDGASILLFLQIRFSPSSVVVLPVLSGGAAPAPFFSGAPPFLG